MRANPAGADVMPFTPARARAAATTLDARSVHLWWLPYQVAQGRAPLKTLLAAYLDTDPAALTLVDGEHGRPRIATPQGLDFNWSHSGEHALVAVARDLPELGVDIERQREHPRALALAKRFFADDEYRALAQLPPALRQQAFMRLWTAKEAVLKAHGRGLAYGLDRVVFTLDASSARPRRFDGDVGEPRQWQLHAMQPASALQATLAWRGDARDVCCFTPAADA